MNKLFRNDDRSRWSQRPTLLLVLALPTLLGTICGPPPEDSFPDKPEPPLFGQIQLDDDLIEDVLALSDEAEAARVTGINSEGTRVYRGNFQVGLVSSVNTETAELRYDSELCLEAETILVEAVPGEVLYGELDSMCLVEGGVLVITEDMILRD